MRSLLDIPNSATLGCSKPHPPARTDSAGATRLEVHASTLPKEFQLLPTSRAPPQRQARFSALRLAICPPSRHSLWVGASVDCSEGSQAVQHDASLPASAAQSRRGDRCALPLATSRTCSILSNKMPIAWDMYRPDWYIRWQMLALEGYVCGSHHPGRCRWAVLDLAECGSLSRSLVVSCPAEPTIAECRKLSVKSTLGTADHIRHSTRPIYGPTVIPPLPWTASDIGGYHQSSLCKGFRVSIMRTKDSEQWEALRQMESSRMAWAQEDASTPVLSALNCLGSQRWCINSDVLRVRCPQKSFVAIARLPVYD
jgi:hypothetical protein